MVDTKLDLSFDEFHDLLVETQVQDFHCVAGWNKFDCGFEGVALSTLADAVGADNDVVHTMFYAMGDYTTNLPLGQYMRGEVVPVWGYDGEGLPADRGDPLRVVTPRKHAYKGAGWASGIKSPTEPERGYWERRGYSNTADP